MLTTLASVLLTASLATAAAEVQPGMELTFQGRFEPARQAEPPQPRKAFQLTLFTSHSADNGPLVYWVVREDGPGGWPWADRFGRVQLDQPLATQQPHPMLLYERADGKSEVPVPVPLVPANWQLAQGAEWEEDQLAYQVGQSTTQNGRALWPVTAQGPFGHKRTLWVDADSAWIPRQQQTIFIGRGDQFQLDLELQEARQLNEDEQKQATETFEALLALRTRLQRPPHASETQWTADQLATLREELPKLSHLTPPTPVGDLIAAAEQDAQDQHLRTNAVAALSAKVLGKTVPEFQLAALQGEAVTSRDLTNDVVILHFWEYRDVPLEEPYGQVAYVDFLYRQRQQQGVKVYGVAVDERHGEASTRRQAAHSVRKLKTFMNLSYPVLLDDGNVLKRFGDPRVTGARLPLFVVLDRGKVIHYHAGHYEVHQQRGLDQLDAIIAEALGKRG